MSKPEYSCAFVGWRDRVVLVRKNHPEWQNNRLNGIGGAAQPGETPLQTAAREWDEETQLIQQVPDVDDQGVQRMGGLNGRVPLNKDRRVPLVGVLEEFLTLEDSEVIVHFFRGQIADDEQLQSMMPRLNDAGETISLLPLTGAYLEWFQPSSAVDNLCWLIPMALMDKFHVSGSVVAHRHVLEGNVWVPDK